MTLSLHDGLLWAGCLRVAFYSPIHVFFLLHSIFINNVFYHIKRAKLHAYTDVRKIYHSDRDPVAL